MPQLPNRIKVTLAYTIARSMWQFYNSYWARIPWTHDNIHLLKERVTEGVLHTRPHPYFITKLHKFTGPKQDFLIADDALHCYPNILSLGIISIEIATQQRFRPDNPSSQWDESIVNDYFEWGLMTANSGILKARIGAHYEKVVNNCLDSDIFKSISEDDCLDPALLEKNIETRQSLLFEKVVLPLHELYYAYRDDWDLQGSITTTPAPASARPPRATESNTAHPAAAFPKLPEEDQPTVAIFYALLLEADAVIELFDETRGGETKKSKKVMGDENIYTFGRISSLNVILIHMGGICKGSAAHAASSLRASYPGVNLALVVGICGGVPGEREDGELILGDVVISDGIVQYDFGRQYPDIYMAKSGSEVLGPPSIKLRGILAMLKGIRSRVRMESNIRSYLTILKDRFGAQKTVYPGIARDTLFQPTYHHKHHTSSCTVCSRGPDSVCTEARTKSCQQLGCEETFLVPRTRLQESLSDTGHPPSPKIHFGLVGSGDTVMKSGQHRDHIATQYNLIAFEMEGSGVWDFFPCLIIKGVCDYADSHNSQHWQTYAASTAAACMRAFLDEWESVH
ncbi:purine and uridine phosphorylase [Aspergillus germanicus]